jgi:hypothetical protein
MAPPCSERRRLAALVVLAALVAACVPADTFTSAADRVAQGSSPPIPQVYCVAATTPVGTGLVRLTSHRLEGTGAGAADRWIGWLSVPSSGEYAFHAPDPHARITVASHAVVVQGRSTGSIPLDATRFHHISIETSAGAAMPTLEWSPPGAARQPVPVARLHAPLATAHLQGVSAPRLASLNR